MVVDTLDNLDQYLPLHPRFATAFEFLRRPELDRLPEGWHEIDGREVHVVVAKDPGLGHAEAPREGHRRGIDIHVCLRGTDELGYKPIADCRQVVEPYSEREEVELYGDEPDFWFPLPPGRFAILWPEDMHASRGAAAGTPLHKLILKVAL